MGMLVAQAAVHVPLVRDLGAPLTATMLLAVDTTLSGSIAHHVTAANLGWMGMVMAIAVAAPHGLRRVWPERIARRRLLAVVLVATPVIGLGPVAARHSDGGALLQNPLVTLVRTAFPRLHARAGDRDWRATDSPGGAGAEVGPPPGLAALAGAARGRSVVLVVLESTGAGYLAPCGAARDPMPRLTELAAGGVTFERAYCVYPESIKGLVPLLFSIYPAIDTAAEEQAPPPSASVAQLLAGRGYRTGLFHSGRFDYPGMRALVDASGFERTEDAGDIGGNHESSFGVDEPATVARMLGWVDSLPPAAPFLLAYLPIAGHHPYDSPPGGPFDESDEIGRYRNALHHADQCLGELVDGLRARRGDELVWVVLGDHGEAFGEHARNFGHTLQIYEENVRVPLVLATPGLGAGGARVERITSSLDVVPTICDLLGVPAHPLHQGRSALAPAPSSALFFTDYAEALLGMREGRWKTILDVSSGRVRLFDLAADPAEATDLASEHRELVERTRSHLMAWAAAQRERVQGARREGISVAAGR